MKPSNYKQLPILFVFLFLLYSCFNTDDDQKKAFSEPGKITVDLDRAKQYSFNELVDTSSLDYVRLESTPESLLGEIKRFYVMDSSFIFISNRKLLVFNPNGKFLYSIDKRGKGPGEYLSLADVCVKKNTVYLLDRIGKKIIKYNTTGEFLGEISTGLNAESFANVDENNFCLYIGSNKNEVSSGRINYYSESQKKIVYKAIPVTEQEHEWMYYLDFNNFTANSNDLLFKYSFNDTIYNLKSNGLNPCLVIDWGQYKLPKKILKERHSDLFEFNNKTNGNYIFSTPCFFSNSTHLSFGFKLKDVMYQVLYTWSDSTLKVINHISDPYGVTGKLAVDFSVLPQSSDTEYFYTLVENHFVNEHAEAGIILPAPFQKSDANKNPTVVKFKYR